VPARAVFEHLGSTVNWHAGHRQVSIFHGNDVLVMTIGSTTANLNGNNITMPTAPIIVNDSTMIPLRFPSEAFGFFVDWDSVNRIAIIDTRVTAPPTQNNPPPTQNDPPPIQNDPPPADEQPHGFDDSDLPPPPAPGGNLPTIPISDRARNISSSPITAIPHSPTTITQIQSPANTGAYVIMASSAISEVSYFILADNRIVIDIHNAISSVTGDIAVDSSVPVSEARAAQFSSAPLITRIVFQANPRAEFSLSLSSDRRALTVAFAGNNITDLSLQSDGNSDSLIIRGNIMPSVRVCTAGFPNFLTININNARMLANANNIESGVFARNFATGQRADGSAYIRVYVGDQWPTFTVTQSDNAVIFMMHHGITGVRYDSARREIHICRSTGFNVDIGQIQHVDEYLRLRYTLILPHAAPMLGRGEIGVMDGLIDTITLDTDPFGNARFVFNTGRVLAFSVHETAESFIIRAHLPSDVRPFIVVIDPGHGGWAPGASHGGVVERELVLIIAHKVMQLLDNNPSISGYMTRWDNTGVFNQRRAEFANELGADLFVSIHANAAELSPGVINPEPNGVETWYNFGELEQSSNNRLTSRQFAEIMQRHLRNRTGAADRGLRYGAGLVVLRDSNMPSALLEIGFLTNPAELARLTTPAHQWQIAHAIYDGIVETFTRFG